MAQFVEHCRARGLSVTPQRLAIYHALITSSQHPSAEDIYRRIRRQYPTISLATVYKTLETLEHEGFISKVTPLHETARYDANRARHHHLICVRCHAIEDFSAEALEHLSLPQEATRSWRVLEYTVQVLGICRECQQKERAS
ncbi:MAG: transcriptional repressor [Blastocatellia bacterium]|nr:transcriptional repressor [Blastocatellia bacterium]MCS7157806.1 transcriptional repressor [Blastocatellia bacterium]MCX7753319.1 transcriptional repressor [Blastocatellia bacterium]MDW8168118.1 Fur family transcriptional regulator [Acidobacteriota bacterium]MDW8257634.1 Fur family transcriptional regulator [Acidobacteriota bacterium]